MDLTVKVQKKEVLEFVRDHGVFWIPTSAATSENVQKLFQDICSLIDERIFELEEDVG
jgi:hypothetical protein